MDMDKEAELDMDTEHCHEQRSWTCTWTPCTDNDRTKISGTA